MTTKQKHFLQSILFGTFIFVVVLTSFFIGLGFNGLIHIQAQGTVIIEPQTGCYLNTDHNITYIANPAYIYSNQNYFLNICNMDNVSTYQLEINYFSTKNSPIQSVFLAGYNLSNTQETYYIPITQLLQNITLEYTYANMQFILLRNSSLAALAYSILIPFNVTLLGPQHHESLST